jgi:hypothetical protein
MGVPAAPTVTTTVTQIANITASSNVVIHALKANSDFIRISWTDPSMSIFEELVPSESLYFNNFVGQIWAVSASGTQSYSIQQYVPSNAGPTTISKFTSTGFLFPYFALLGDAQAALTSLNVNGFNMNFNGTTWDRMKNIIGVRGTTGIGLLATHLTNFDGTNYNRSMVPGTGTIKTITITAPGAGVEFTVTVPAGKVWRIQSLRYLFSSANAGATRTSNLKMTDGTNTLAVVVPFAQQAINVSNNPYTWTIGILGGGSTFGNDVNQTIPAIVLAPSSVISSLTGALNAGDTYTSLFLLVEEFVL